MVRVSNMQWITQITEGCDRSSGTKSVRKLLGMKDLREKKFMEPFEEEGTLSKLINLVGSIEKPV